MNARKLDRPAGSVDVAPAVAGATSPRAASPLTAAATLAAPPLPPAVGLQERPLQPVPAAPRDQTTPALPGASRRTPRQIASIGAAGTSRRLLQVAAGTALGCTLGGLLLIHLGASRSDKTGELLLQTGVVMTGLGSLALGRAVEALRAKTQLPLSPGGARAAPRAWDPG